MQNAATMFAIQPVPQCPCLLDNGVAVVDLHLVPW